MSTLVSITLIDSGFMLRMMKPWPIGYIVWDWESKVRRFQQTLAEKYSEESDRKKTVGSMPLICYN